ncbi:MAG: PHP domain-containing protein [Spirochaetaceae bacterium]|nr:PHP domain-containing protein [Spirochaetaceae bacterium]
MKYLYETHLHTAQGSACANSRGRDYIRHYKDKGYTGVIVTDHFFNSNTAIDLDMPWKRWVEEYCRGYEEARQEGERIGVDVFFGWEESFDGDDYLVYGLGKEWLLEHPEAARWTVPQQYRAVHKYGGCVVHAHPFRYRGYIPRIYLSPRWVDAVEAANSANDPSSDALAMCYAKSQGLPVTAGSDIHGVNQLKTGPVFGVCLDKKMETIQDYVRAIRTGAIAGLLIPEGRCSLRRDEDIPEWVYVREGEGRVTRQSMRAYIAPEGQSEEYSF